jgi:ferritin-like metal-binding protein YciE
MNDLEKLMIGELHDVYDAEQQLVKALPDMGQKATSPGLKRAFATHLGQTRNHVRRLEEVFRLLGQEPRRKSCKGMEGLIDEGQLIATEFEKNSALDAGLIAAAQKVEHYEIATYGTLVAWAEVLATPQVASLLNETLAEEKQTDSELTEMAMERANVQAESQDTAKKSESVSAAKKFVTKGP